MHYSENPERNERLGGKAGGYALLEEVGERSEQDEGDDVPIHDEHDLADAHVERRPADNVEPCKEELQGQHSDEQLQLLRGHHRCVSPSVTS